MTKSNQSSLDIADHLGRGEYDWCPEAETRLREQHDRIAELEKKVFVLQNTLSNRTLNTYDGTRGENE